MKYLARKLVSFKIFEVIIAVLLNIQHLCDIMPYRVVDTNVLKDTGLSETPVTLYQSTRLTLQKTLILGFRLITL